MDHEPSDIPPDLRDVAHALREHRPRMSGPQLARARERATAGGSRTATAPRGGFMRSRIAITALLATGALMSSGGAALGISALSTTSDAGQAQYGPVATTPSVVGPSGETLGGPVARGPEADSAPVGPSGEPAQGESRPSRAQSRPDANGTQDATAAVQPARQLEAGGNDELPFTGYAAIPLLLLGLGLLVAGLVLRRGTTPARIT